MSFKTVETNKSLIGNNQIFLDLGGGRLDSIDVKPSDTVSDLKGKIFSKYGQRGFDKGIIEQWRAKNQNLNFNHENLKDGYMLSRYHITKKNPIALSFNSIDIFVMTVAGKKITIPVTSHNNISIVKQRIFDKECIPFKEQRLIFNGKQLEDGRTLFDYGALPESRFFLVLRIYGGSPSFTNILDTLDFNSLKRAKLIDFSNESTPWNCITKGLNFRAMCKSSNCSDTKYVWIKKGFGKFNIIKEVFNSNCPKCKEKVTPTNLGLWDCDFSIQGIWQNSKLEEKELDTNGEAPKEKFLVFINKKRAKWVYLEVTTSQRLEIMDERYV